MVTRRSHIFLEVLADQIRAKLVASLGLPADRAARFGLEVAKDVRRVWGGLAIYICKAERENLKEKHDRVYEAYLKGGSAKTIGRKFGYSAQRIRQIVAAKSVARGGYNLNDMP
jgi:Mor family transcriptional regulator